MIFKVRINNEKEFNLCNWNNTSFDQNPTLQIQSDNFNEVKSAFTNVTLLELYQNDNKICEYTSYDTYESIIYEESVFAAGENAFLPCLEVQLKKTSLVEQVQRLEDTINPVIDINSMGIDEYRDFIFKQISEDCTKDIYLGTKIEVNGTQQNFSFKSEDQINLLQLYLLTKMYPSITAVPYHADGNTCMFYTASQIQTIYMTLIIRLVAITTYYNQLHLYAKTLTTKEELSQLRYGMELPEQYASVVDSIVSQTVSALEGIVEEGNSNEKNDVVGD